LKQMPKDKASHSDSFTINFYQSGGLLLKQGLRESYILFTLMCRLDIGK
jgi:hypothetical protein